jgi:hypothetical protein
VADFYWSSHWLALAAGDDQNMYVRGYMRGVRGLGQDDSDFSSLDLSTLTAPTIDTSDLSSSISTTVSSLTSPLFLIGAALLGGALLLSKGQKSLKRRRKRKAKQARIKAEIRALKSEL